MTRPSLRPAAAVLALSAVWLLVAVALGTAGLLRPVPPWLLWPAAIGATATATVACRIAASTGHAVVRAFWRRLTKTWVFLTAGGLVQLVSRLFLDHSEALNPVAAVCFAVAAAFAMAAVVRLPHARRTWRSSLAIGLDMAIVTTAAAIIFSHFLWHTANPATGGTATATFLLIVMITGSAAVAAVIKAGITGAGPALAPALWTLAPIGLISPASWMLAPPLAPWPHLDPSVASLPVSSLIVAIAAWVQSRVNAAGRPAVAQSTPTRRGGPWRNISLVPYLAVAAVATLLVVVTLRMGYLTPGLAGGSVVLTVLVVTRQLIALLDNAVLLDRLEDQAHHDDLTGLPNRRLFTATLARRTEQTTVAVCDLDGFAALNDRLGDETGDALLRAAAERVTAVTGAGAVVARLLGDEFGVLMPGGETVLAETLVDAFRTPLRVDSRDLLVTVTAGVATGVGDEVPDLLRRAEVALQAAKYTGADRAREHSSALDATAQHHAELAAALRRGLELNEFRLLYQPIVELPSGTVTGVEALIRWHPADQPVISPAEFIPVAEHSGLIIDLGAWILDQACADAAAWQREHGAGGPRVNINVSARQLLDPDLPGLVANALHRHGLAPDRITIEITETAVFAGGAALETVRELRELGVGLALDDFGTGHSSLTLLRTCPVTTLKVDKSFIDDLNGTAEQEAIASSLSTIATTLGLRAVAEGVETRDQADRLHALGYRYAQGFYFARPVPAADITALLTAPALTP
ncbi:putative bifunctional diguanylate cyclase/phosphodiesterase [Actinoplanes sichuanensis]|uniref:Bifunctional diguanylate cyclase/phosphodiesterase n=1 Tax=Actinoplanes sichuanensis TaxID=512349 RepID=A0ABW4A3P8_9ACTN|nr:bifunctional diguanylate cyclase/phosphodiesterase [Actinoplanes sichuanensis]